LSWAHYRALCQVEDEAKRAALLRETLQRGLTSPQVIERVRALNAASPDVAKNIAEAVERPLPRLLTPKRGTPGVYRVVQRGDVLAVDLGFRLYVELADEGFKAGEFVRCDARGRVLAAEDATKADLFTYTATIRRVVDGDTLAIEIRLPRGYVHEMKLRLRALDCPEMDTAEGKAAKRFTESLVASATAVTIYTTKPDKYDRYLADVFVANGDGPSIYLNNELLKSGHAVRKDEYSLADWTS
jgi:endonuclease YncB( thermonuclease family)